jgi:hypothetical protein
MKTLFYQLDQLSNLHFTPRPAEAEAGISTQNVPSLMIEDAIPIAVNAKGQSKSARETFSINNQKLREKSELSKEERHKERATRKRKIKAHLKHKELTKKEKRRDQGVAMHDRFEARQVNKKNTEKGKKDSAKEEGPQNKRNDMKSAKFFSRLQDVAKDDAARKDQKRKAKADGVNAAPTHTN